MRNETPVASGASRRLAATIYDLILLFAVLFLATLPVLPITGGAAVASNNGLYGAYLLIWAYLYYAWQWIHGGQTLGMRTWKIMAVQANGEAINWKLASLRYLLALISSITLGGGFLWAIFDPEKLTLHDRFSNTRIIRKEQLPAPQ